MRRGVLAIAPPSLPAVPVRRTRELTNLRAARAAALTCSRAVISHASSAIAQGMPAYDASSCPCLTVPAGTALRNLADVHLHRASLTPGDVQTADGYWITRPARTVLDIARESGLDAGVVAADFALRERLTTMRELNEAIDRCARWPGLTMAQESVRLADPRSESVLETLSRLRILAGELPAPEPQMLIYDRQGMFLGRCDFYWDELGIVGEADGDAKYRMSDTPMPRQAVRQDGFEATGLGVVRWGWSDLYEFDAVVRRVHRAAAIRRQRKPERRAWVAVPS